MDVECNENSSWEAPTRATNDGGKTNKQSQNFHVITLIYTTHTCLLTLDLHNFNKTDVIVLPLDISGV